MTGIWTIAIVTFLGSALGGRCRYLLSGTIGRRFGERFPMGILLVNVSGAFLIGIVWSLPWNEAAAVSVVARDFLMFGFLGGYTTVSSFSLNTLNLLREGEWRYASFNLFGSFFLCFGAVFAGAAVVRVW